MATVAKVTANSYGNLGAKGTRKDNDFVAIDGIILVTPTFSAANTVSELATEATWTAGIKAGTVFPLTGMDGYEVQSSEDTIYESPAGTRKLLKRGKSRYMFRFDIPFDVHRTLMTDFNSADLHVYFIMDGKILFYLDSTTAKGFSLSMLNIGRLADVPEDGATPAYTPIYMDLEDYRQKDIYGETVEPSWNVNDLEPLTDVSLETVGTPTDSEVIVRVYTADGYDSDGASDKVGISGIAEDDWTITFGTATSYTDNGDGTYTWASTAAFSTGTATLKTPPNMTNSTFDDLRINYSGDAVAVTI